METTNKIALVTGANRGLGKNMALQLAQSGTDIIVTYRSNQTEADSVVAEIMKLGRKAFALPLDVTQVASFPDFFGKVKTSPRKNWNRDTFDFLVNNAGIGVHKSFVETTEEDFDNLMQTHFKGVYFLTQKALPFLEDGGRIINISSGLARFATPGYSAYAAMKGAVEVLTRYLAKELGSRKITVNVVAPGIMQTDFTKNALSNPGAEDYIKSITALGRVGQPDDVGGVVAFLCSDAARWVTAQRIEASGGMFL